MITDICQRFTFGRESRRAAGEQIKTSDFEVHPIGAKVAKAFVREHHYATTCSSTAHCFGLFMHGELVGVACFGPAASMNAHRAVFPTISIKQGISLGRLVLVDEVPGNGESWFVARCMELLASPKLYKPTLRDGSLRLPIIGVESCADPQPRSTSRGLVFRGHLGIVYQSTNGHYVGKTNPSTLRLFPDGAVFSNRASGKVVQGDQGTVYAEAQLVSWGAVPLASGEDAKRWIKLWRDRLTQKMRHYGNHRYIWSLDKRRSQEILRAPALPYPKTPEWLAARAEWLARQEIIS